MTHWTADTLPDAALITGGTAWLGLQLLIALTTVKDMVRDARQREPSDPLADYGLTHLPEPLPGPLERAA